MDEMVIANDVKKLRACYGCHLVKSERQFKNRSCENCDCFKDMNFFSFTSANFESLVVIMDPQFSWVARYQMRGKY